MCCVTHVFGWFFDILDPNTENTDWKLWIDNEFSTSNFILVVCTESYTNCFNNNENCTGEGGVKYEARLIRDILSKDNVLPIILNKKILCL